MTVPKRPGSGLISDPSQRFVTCFEDALKMLRSAADQWAKGDPEKPPTAEILSGLLDVFGKDGFLRRPID
jgi:hypothetical protein